MTFAHFIYIPGVLLVGVTIGYILGARAVRAEVARLRKRMKE
jgi:proteasome assembly chaperone (PAC2) family protein